MCTPGQLPEARGFRSPGAGVAVACCGCWEPNSLQEQLLSSQVKHHWYFVTATDNTD